MFEKRKARELGIRDKGRVPKGKILSYQFSPPRLVDRTWLHAECMTRLRDGVVISTGQQVTWCSKCRIIVNEITKTPKPN